MDASSKARAAALGLTRGTRGPGDRSAANEFDLASSAESILDAAVEFTFPASDPISVDHAFMSASRRERAVRVTHEPDALRESMGSSPVRRKIRRTASTN